MPFNKEKAAPVGAAFKNNLQKESYQKPHSKQANYTVVKKDFARLNQAALNQLPRLLAVLAVSFREEHHEIVMLNSRRPDTHYGSFRINRNTGLWGDFALYDVRGGDAVSLVAYIMNVRKSAAAMWINRVLGGGK